MVTWPELHAKHKQEQRELILEALRTSGWVLARAARALAVTPTTLASTVTRDPVLQQAYQTAARALDVTGVIPTV